MLSVSSWIIMFCVLLICTVIYLASLLVVVSLLKKTYPDYWRRIGSPNLMDPNSITIVFPKIIFGRDVPEDAKTKYRTLLWTLRASLLISTIIVIYLMIMMSLGRAPR